MNLIDKAELLIKEYQHTDDKERVEEEIIYLYDRTIGYILKNFEKFNYYEDMRQEVLIALIKAIRTYDVHCNIRFSTYAVNSMRFIIFRKIRYQHLVRIPEYLDLSEHAFNIHSNWMLNKRNEEFDVYDLTLSKGLNTINYDINVHIMNQILNEKEFKIAYLYYLGYKQADISKIIDLTTSRIGQILINIRKKLKNQYTEII